MQSISYSTPLGDEALLGHRLEALRRRHVDQLDVGPVEGLVVIVVRQRPLAHEAVPGLQRLGGRRVLDELVDAAAHALHHAEVHHLAPRHELFAASISGLPSASSSALMLRLISVQKSQIRSGASRGRISFAARRKFSCRSACQPGLSEAAHAGIGRRVVALVDARRGALQHVELLGVLAEVRHRLDRGRAGAEDRDALVGELVEHRVVPLAAGVLVVPARGVELVALEVVDARDVRELGGVSVPPAMITKRARISSSRLVRDAPALDAPRPSSAP